MILKGKRKQGERREGKKEWEDNDCYFRKQLKCFPLGGMLPHSRVGESSATAGAVARASLLQGGEAAVALEGGCLEPADTLASNQLFDQNVRRGGINLTRRAGALYSQALVLPLLRSVGHQGPSGPRKQQQKKLLNEYIHCLNIYIYIYEHRGDRCICIISELQQANQVHARA